MNCPLCKTDTFITKSYEGVEIDVCKTCQGIWLDQGEIQQIVENRITEFSEQDKKQTISLAFPGIPESEKNKELACPKCGEQLRPINYAVDSGIIIDTCPNNHGIWLDCHELQKVQEFREYWADNAYNNTESLQNLLKGSDTEKPEVSKSILFNIAATLSQYFE